MFESPMLLDTKIDQHLTELERLSVMPGVKVFDTYNSQVSQLMSIRHPNRKLSESELNKLSTEYYENHQGKWCYYPWNQHLVHILDQEGFIELRTNRNKYKITEEEQSILRDKSALIIGLSVGSSIALTLAMERIVGTLILVDFDQIELSNLNRLAAGVHQIGMPKTTRIAQLIAEIDPYIKLITHNDGFNLSNNQEILNSGTKIDIVLDECDDMQIKWLLRKKAKEMNIPVLMETNDRGQIDIERFDLEPSRPIFHGRLEGLEYDNLDFKDPGVRFLLLSKILDIQLGSERAQYSLGQIGHSIQTWPQLASTVMLGAGICSDITRKILLGQPISSGRYFIDLDQLIK
jgi:hypothetical protein